MKIIGLFSYKMNTLLILRIINEIFSRPTSFLPKSSCRVSSEKNILNSSVESCGVESCGIVWSGKIG